jgi:ribosomal-protein-alanine N-acetyltransferase
MKPAFDFAAFPVLHSPRLVLREILPTDADTILKIRGDIRVTRLNSGKPIETVDEARDLIEKGQLAFEDKRRIDWGIASKAKPEKLIGRCGFNYWLRQDRRASIGYDLGYAYWGKGIMTEAVTAMVRFGFEQMGLNRIEADTDAENIGSMRVLEKVGFKREGVQHEQYFEWNEFHDLVLFALLRKDFAKLRER